MSISARSEGASLVTGGERVGDRGYFISPAVFANVEHEMRISQEEIFGPVVSVIKFSDEADALRIANGTAYSLAAGVWSRDIGRVQRFAKKAQGRHGLDQHLWLYRCAVAVGRRSAIPASAANTALPRSRTSPSRRRSG